MRGESREIDSMLGVNKPKKEIKEQLLENGQDKGRTVYDSVKDEYVPVEELPFAANEGQIILEKGNEKDIKRAKNSGIVLNTIKEYDKVKEKENISCDTAMEELEDDDGLDDKN